VGVAFIDTNIYIHQLLSIKSLILVADVYKSISLLRFQEEYRTLSLVSRVGSIYNISFPGTGRLEHCKFVHSLEIPGSWELNCMKMAAFWIVAPCSLLEVY
jgi:hypothetical protein